MGIMNPKQFATLVEPGLREAFFTGHDSVAEVYSKIFHVLNSTSATEDDLEMVGLGNWTETPDGELLKLDQMDEGYSTTYTHTTFKQGMQITRDMIEDDKYNVMSTWAQRLGFGAAVLREKEAANVFNNAFDTNYVGGDGKPLCSTAHPYKTLSGTQSNKGTAALAQDALKAARVSLMGQLNNRKQKMMFSDNLLLIVPPDLTDTALILTRSVNEPGSADNDINVNKGRYTVITMNQLTSSTAWFIVDPMLLLLNFFWRV